MVIKMTNEEKLKHFYEVTVQAANEKNKKALQEYQEGLEKNFLVHKEEEQHKQELQLKLARVNIKKEKNMEFAAKQMEIRKTFGEKQDEIKDKLFQSATEKLEEYKKTSDYLSLLTSYIKQAKAFAKGKEIEIYIDPMDADKKTELEQNTNTEIIISEYSFQGGIRAVIRSKNILIDRSFETKMKEIRNEFSFHISE